MPTLLVANRGEIAVRVIRTARAMGWRTIAVYSDADVDAVHCQAADSSVYLGGPRAADSYLNVDAIIDAAHQSNANFVHPGYGFLSESVELVHACEAANLTFVGPSERAIEVMGNKAVSKRLLLESDVAPCIPGYQGLDQSDTTLIKEATTIGFPVLIKAAAGGGGKGMRIAEDEQSMTQALELARSEAKNAFGSDELILEKQLIDVRHVEIQVFSDSHGSHVHLWDRDCTVQRRHQKVIEEAPCPSLPESVRKQMGAVAVAIAKSIDYLGAGTVEFVVDNNNNFYFLEMNTRLQVEHPVTEMVTGYDLVEWQLRVAMGEPLPATQDQISCRGHAIEARLYAEDPNKNFLPAPGKVHKFYTSSNARTDSGIVSGQEITPFYDPMVAKVIAYGDSREQAQQRLVNALHDTAIFNGKNNKNFLLEILNSDQFVGQTTTTKWLDDSWQSTPIDTQTVVQAQMIAAVLLSAHKALKLRKRALDISQAMPLETLNTVPHIVQFSDNAKEAIAINHCEAGYHCSAVIAQDTNESSQQSQSESIELTIELKEITETSYQITIAGKSHKGLMHIEGDRIWLTVDGHDYQFQNQLTIVTMAAGGNSSGIVTSPMHGNLLRVAVAVGDKVKINQTVAIVEAMKMEHELKAEIAGTVAEITAQESEKILSGQQILSIEPNK